jgi:hypothetical protein
VKATEEGKLFDFIKTNTIKHELKILILKLRE